MAFNMNKPVIKGTKEHSALLAKASGTVDPTLGTAASMYGQSMSPDVIDYNIKQTEIEWGEKKKKEEPNGEEADLTLNDRKKKAADNDKEDALKKLIIKLGL